MKHTVVCKYFVAEFQTRLAADAGTKAVIETGHGLEKKKRIPYLTSDVRLTEALTDPHICDKILEYNVHAEREGSLRYAKGQSETITTLQGLVNKGVKVDLGIPEAMWNDTSAEISKMRSACATLVEEYEDDIEEWFYHHQDEDNLAEYLCERRYLKNMKFPATCLKEITHMKGDTGRAEDATQKKKKQQKKKQGKKDKRNKKKTEADPRKDSSKKKTNKKSNKKTEL